MSSEQKERDPKVAVAAPPEEPEDFFEVVGKTLDGRYLIEAQIGEGAQGVVYRARQLRLKRSVAVRILKPHLARDKDYMAVLEREAATMSSCVRENIVTIYDIQLAQSEDELSYVVMEMVSGVNLEEFVLAGDDKLTIGDVLDLLGQVARGIDAAHAVGVVHRDIKPRNLIVTKPERVIKVMDFGMAKNVHDTASTSGVRGPPDYLAPEEITNGALGTYTDIYVFGAVIYRLLARAPHYDGATPKARAAAIAEKPPVALLDRNPNWPPAVEEVLKKCLATDSSERPTTATAVVDELAKALCDRRKRRFSEFFKGLSEPGEPSPHRAWVRHAVAFFPYILVTVGLVVTFFLVLLSEPAESELEAESGGGKDGGAVVEVPQPAPPQRVDPARLHPLEGEAKKVDSRLILEDLVYRGIRLPIFRGKLEEAWRAFKSVSDPASTKEFFELIEQLRKTHKALKLKFDANDTIYSDRADVEFRFEIVGKPNDVEGPHAAAEETLIKEFRATVHFTKKDGEWRMMNWPSKAFMANLVLRRTSP